MECESEYQCSLYILCPLRKILEKEIEAEFKEKFDKYVAAFDAAPKEPPIIQTIVTIIDDTDTERLREKLRKLATENEQLKKQLQESLTIRYIRKIETKLRNMQSQIDTLVGIELSEDPENLFKNE